MPPDNLQQFIKAIDSKNIFRILVNDEPRLVSIKKIVQIHHTFRVVYNDILLQKNNSIVLSNKLVLTDTGKEFNNFFDKGFDNYEDINIVEDEYYQIRYIDRANRLTTRIIKCTGSNEHAVFAQCTLRENQDRIFRKEGILMIRQAKSTFKNLIDSHTIIGKTKCPLI